MQLATPQRFIVAFQRCISYDFVFFMGKDTNNEGASCLVSAFTSWCNELMLLCTLGCLKSSE